MTKGGLGYFVDRMTLEFTTLRAEKDFSKGELVLDLSVAEVLDEPDYTSIDLGDSNVYHPVGRYINHACNPTSYVDADRKAIVAVGTIKPGDEITFNYLVSERQIVAPFDCACGWVHCVGRIEKRFAQPSESLHAMWASIRKRIKRNPA